MKVVRLQLLTHLQHMWQKHAEYGTEQERPVPEHDHLLQYSTPQLFTDETHTTGRQGICANHSDEK